MVNVSFEHSTPKGRGENCSKAIRKEIYSSKLVLKDVVSGLRNVGRIPQRPPIRVPHESGTILLVDITCSKRYLQLMAVIDVV